MTDAEGKERNWQKRRYEGVGSCEVVAGLPTSTGASTQNKTNVIT
jgi:hypothetical protein